MDIKAAAEGGIAFTFGPFRLVPGECQLLRDGEPVALTPHAFDLLCLLVTSAGHLKTREELIEALWPSTVVEEANLSWNLRAVRKALGDEGRAPRYIETVRGRGYRFIAPVERGGCSDSVAAGNDAADKGRLWLGLSFGTLVAAALVAGVFVLWPHTFGDSAVDSRQTSIAVLPFENLNLGKEDAYFVAGTQGLILTRLAEIGQLKVISRTSTAHYNSHPDDLKAIARQLGVSTILEGSVQQAGGEVMVNVQLVDARTDSHIWAQAYTRKLDNVLGVEGEVAQNVADALKARLTAPQKQRLARIPTRNPAAYKAYLHAHAANTRQDTIAAYQKAVSLDPDFGLAWAGLANVEVTLNARHLGDFEQSRTSAGQALDKALALAPDAAATRLAQGRFRLYVQQDARGALTACNEALAAAPGNTDALGCVIKAGATLGHWQQVLDQSRKAVALDPLNPGTLVMAASYFADTRDDATAVTLYDRALALRPGNYSATVGKVWIFWGQGRLAAAGKLLAGLKKPGTDMDAVYLTQNLVWQKFLLRDYAGAAALIRPLLASSSSVNADWRMFYWVDLGVALQHAGQAQAARNAFEQARKGALQMLARKHSDQYSNAEVYEALSLAEAGLGHKQAALDAAHQAIALVPTSQNALKGPAMERNLAWVEAWVGDHDAAIAALPRLLRLPGSMLNGQVTVPLLKLNPFWDPLRKDPRFQALVKPQAGKAWSN